MKLLLGWMMAAGALPNLAAGPDLAVTAQPVDAPIAAVTVYSDRARVRRVADVNLPGGDGAIRLPDLPGGAMLDTVRLSTSKGRVARVEVTPVERERYSLEQIDELLERIEVLTDRLAGLDGQRAVEDDELAFLAALSPAPPVAESERVGRPVPTLAPKAIDQTLAFVAERGAKARARRRQIVQRRRSVARELAALQREVAQHDLGGRSDRRLQVLALLSGARGATTVTLEYFVPGARWRPSYDLHYAPKNRGLRLEIGGRVEQATGEDWAGVELSLSTAIPGQSIELPELLTWTLGERRELVPRPRPERQPPTPSPYRAPADGTASHAASEAARAEITRQRLGQLHALLGLDGQAEQSRIGDVSVDVGGTLAEAAAAYGGGASSGYGVGSMGSASGSGGIAVSRGVSGAKRSQHRGRRAKSAPPAAPMASAEIMADEALSWSGDRGARAVPTPMGLFDANAWRRPTFRDPSLPAMIAGGFDYVYEASTRADVPSDGQAVEVPLAVERWTSDVHYEASPALSTTGYLTASVRNTGARPILRGPVDIFVAGDFSGSGELQTTGAGGLLKLPLGADEDLRIEHHVAPTTATEGIVSKSEVTTYEVVTEIANYKARAIEIDVFDVLPRTNNEDIEIRLKASAPKAAEGPGDTGRLRWRLALPAGGKATLEWSYTIERPLHWQLHQR